MQNNSREYGTIRIYPWDILSKYKNISFIEQNLDLSWDWPAINLNKTITAEFLEKYFGKLWSYNTSYCHTATIKIIAAHIDKKWNLETLYTNSLI